jgi:tRNA threonylcarbamoyladenosine biosynthesis protein TsaB
MIVLGIDTAAAHCAVALVRDGIGLGVLREPGRRGQSERLLPMLAACLRQAGLAYGDLQAVAAATGPGSFTGLRVGLAAAQGLALACTVPALGIDSFTAFRLSQPVEDGSNTLIIIESHRAELYWQLIDAAGKALSVPACDEVSHIVAALPAGPLTVIGDGAGHLEAALSARKNCRIFSIDGPSATAIALEGERLLGLNLTPPATAFYVRPADARPTNAS